jgi:hypothetical protein
MGVQVEDQNGILFFFTFLLMCVCVCLCVLCIYMCFFVCFFVCDARGFTFDFLRT